MSKRTEKVIHRAWKSCGDWWLCTPTHGDAYLYRAGRSRARHFELWSVVRTDPVMLFEALCTCNLWFSVMSNVLTRDYFTSWGTAWPLSPPLIVGVRSHGGGELLGPFLKGVCRDRVWQTEKSSAKNEFSGPQCGCGVFNLGCVAVGAGPGSPWDGRLSSGSITYISIHTYTF